MDIGSLVVDLVSFVIVTSAFTIALALRNTHLSDEQRSASDDLADRGYYGGGFKFRSERWGLVLWCWAGLPAGG